MRYERKRVLPRASMNLGIHLRKMSMLRQLPTYALMDLNNIDLCLIDRYSDYQRLVWHFVSQCQYPTDVPLFHPHSIPILRSMRISPNYHIGVMLIFVVT